MRAINAKQLHEMMLKHPGIPVVDVLAREAHAIRHIPGSLSIPLTDTGFLERVRRVTNDTTQPIVVYCKDRACDASPRAAAQLEAAGYERVFDFEGGLDEWEHAGYSLVSG